MTRKRQRSISMVDKLTQGANSQAQLHPSPSSTGNTIGGPFRSILERLTQGVTSQPQLHPTPPSTGIATHSYTYVLFFKVIYLSTLNTCICVINASRLGGSSRSIPERLIRGVTSQPQLHPTPPSTGGSSRLIPERLIRGVTSQPQLPPTPPSTANTIGGPYRLLSDAEQPTPRPTEDMVPSQTTSSHSRVVASHTQSHLSAPSIDTSSHIAASVNTTGESNNIRKGRGVACHHPSCGMGQRLEVEMNQFMQPIGPNASKLISQLGCIVRYGERVPLTYAKWTDAPNHVLEDIWCDVKDNSNVPDGHRDCCLRKIGSLWRGWKARLKDKYYYENLTNPEKLFEVPDKVSSDQWPTLVRFWNTEEAERICDNDLGVMGATLCPLFVLITTEANSYKELVISFVNNLKEIAERRLPKTYDYHQMSAPFI